MKFEVHTFGCKVNTYDSGLVQKNLEAAGLRFDANVHVINSCAVTGEATQQAVREVRRIRSKNPFSTIVVTGCAAQVDTDMFSNLSGVDLVVANSHKSLLPELLEKHFKGTLEQKVWKSNIFRKEDLEPGGGVELSHTRAFVKIQDGCNSFCTFCIIPYARGKSRSIGIDDLVKRVQQLYDQGVRETVLTGVHIGDYEDNSLVLEDLIEAMLKRTQMPRFRLTSLEPIELTDRMLDLYQDPRMCPHFHMSIQSANTKVLHDMKRKYTREQVIESFQKIQEKVPGAFVGMDVIVGFPTETEEDFLDTYKALSDSPWSWIHVFPYSERSGTRAAVMTDKVEWAVRKKRAQRLRELSIERHRKQAQDQSGQIKKVLVLKKPSDRTIGLSRDYWHVGIDAEGLEAGSEVNVKIVGAQFNPQGFGQLTGVLA